MALAPRKKGLGAGPGRGLGALLGDAALEDASNDFVYLPIRKVEPREEQPRSVFEKEKIAELADSIREHGILSPLTVRRHKDDLYQIVAGERRWRAAREAGLEEVPARIVVADDREALQIALVENLQREDLNPIEEARGYKSLMDGFDMTQEDVAQTIGKSRPAVANALRLLALPAQVLDLVGSGALPAGAARALLALERDDDMLAAAKLATERGMNVREVEALAKRMAGGKHGRGRKKGKKARGGVDYTADAQNRLTAALGRRVTIKRGRGGGRLEIAFYGDDDFNVLFDALIACGGGGKEDGGAE
jgi:ParB family chromosome partitioning protein